MADLSDDDYDAIASQVAQRLDTGRYGSRFVLSRRQLLSIAGGSAGVAGLVALGVDPATAQSAAGQVGTQSSPEDVFAFDLHVQNGAEFNGSDVTGVGSLSTENATVTGSFSANTLTQGAPTSPRQWVSHGNTSADFTGILQSTTSITADNTFQDTIDVAAVDEPLNTGMAVISGVKQGASDAFGNRILIARVDGVSAASDPAIRGSPGARGYRMNGSRLQVQIDDSGATYDVGLTYIGALNV